MHLHGGAFLTVTAGLSQPVVLNVDPAKGFGVALDIIDRGEPLQLAVGARNSGDQGSGVFVIGGAKDLRDITGFHHFAAVHHHDPISDIGDDANVMGHDDDAQIAFPAQPFQQIKDLRLDRHIQRGCRLIRDDQIGIARKGQRDDHPLTHAARELVRIGAQPCLGLGDADLFQQFHRTGFGLGILQSRGFFNRFNQLRADGHQGIERGLRILEDHPDPVAPDPAHLVLVAPTQLFALKQDRAARNAPRRLQEVNDRVANGGFPGAGFPDQTDDFARLHGQRHIARRLDRAAAGWELDTEPFDF